MKKSSTHPIRETARGEIFLKITSVETINFMTTTLPASHPVGRFRQGDMHANKELSRMTSDHGIGNDDINQEDDEK